MIIQRVIRKIMLVCSFRVGVNVIGIPEHIDHFLPMKKKEKNISSRYSYREKQKVN
jgi:hypothetical protein